jgi:hypothetical protein
VRTPRGERTRPVLEKHERLALELLAAAAGDAADVRAAMSKTIAAAPEGADVALLLSVAMAHTVQRPLNPDRGRGPSRGWALAALPFLGAGAGFWRLGEAILRVGPNEGADAAAALAAASAFTLSVGFLGAALVGVETWVLLRLNARSRTRPVVSPPWPPGWYADPWRQAPTRWWNGVRWTGHLR